MTTLRELALIKPKLKIINRLITSRLSNKLIANELQQWPFNCYKDRLPRTYLNHGQYCHYEYTKMCAFTTSDHLKTLD